LILQNKDGKLARKIFKSQDSTDSLKTFKLFVNEWLNQTHVNRLVHNNLMQALAAFEHEDTDFFFILFELAESNLDSFLTGNSAVQFTSQNLWLQVQGLVDGLASLHGVSPDGDDINSGVMIHRDLKPANILIVNGVMKIADFGISTKSQSNTILDSSIRTSQWAAIGSYFPPPGMATHGTKFDLYSLGCIISEIACFDEGTCVRVQEYRDRREKDNPDEESGIPSFSYHSTCKMKESVSLEHLTVSQNMERALHSTYAESDYWKLQFYQRGIFDAVEEMLDLSKNHVTAIQVAERLKDYINEASYASDSRRQSSSCGTMQSNEEVWKRKIKKSFADEPAKPEFELYVTGRCW